jgi:hypothetical protein
VGVHRYARKVRADDADVASAVGDTHEPAVTAAAIGLQTTRREKLAAPPA